MTEHSHGGLPPSAIEYIIDHVFLPPKLPTTCDENAEANGALLEMCIAAISEFKKSTTAQYRDVAKQVLNALQTLKRVHDFTGAVDEDQLRETLRTVVGSDTAVPLHIRDQNAGVLIRRTGLVVHFEAFELAPRDESVLNCVGRLQRVFPGHTMAVDVATFREADFQHSLAYTLSSMSSQPVSTGKSASHVGGTIDPRAVTQLLMTWLGALGKLGQVAQSVEVTQVSKNTREEVISSSAEQSPWRRSPFWLLIRVSMQLIVSQAEECGGCRLYKLLMVAILVHIMEVTGRHASNDRLHLMKAKVARRMMKLGPGADGDIPKSVNLAIQKAHSRLQKRRDKILEDSNTRHDLVSLEGLDPSESVPINLRKLDEHLVAIKSRDFKGPPSTLAPAQKAASLKFWDDGLPKGIPTADHVHLRYNLKYFERWVATDLSAWVQRLKTNSEETSDDTLNACRRLRFLMHDYHRDAQKTYEGDPEALSTMVLVLFELWVACDEYATHHHPLLRDYHPGVPYRQLQSLLLLSLTDMKRLRDVEEYIVARCSRKNLLPAKSVFEEFGTANSFSVKFFNSSTKHQELRQKIVDEANEAKKSKLDELKCLTEEHQSLKRRFREAECEYEDPEDLTSHLSSTCKKCEYKKQIEAHKIVNEEWPLPAEDLAARSTVFELQVPESFGYWRDATAFLVLDVAKATYAHPTKLRGARHKLYEDDRLSDHMISLKSPRISLVVHAGRTWQNGERVRPQVRLLGTAPDKLESLVCPTSTVQWRYFDDKSRLFAQDFDRQSAVRLVSRMLAYRLPDHASSIQAFCSRDAASHSALTPNTVISSQFDCPDGMGTEEYKALCTLPFGHKLQWQNILRELRMPSVDFKKEETEVFILQMIHQAGPPLDPKANKQDKRHSPQQKSRALRQSHELLGDVDFARSLLGGLEQALKRINGNWELARALELLISIAARVLSLNSDDAVQSQCLKFLSKARKVANGWARALWETARCATDGDQRSKYRIEATRATLICASSYHISRSHLRSLLSSADEASILIQCAITIHEKIECTPNPADPIHTVLLNRWKSVSCMTVDILRKEILKKKNEGLDKAVFLLWELYQPGEGWDKDPNDDHWLRNTLLPQGESRPCSVRFNLLTGEFLMNGLPLSKLPSSYDKSLTLKQLFGDSPDVITSPDGPLHFVTAQKYENFNVHLGMFRKEVRVLAVSENEKYELVPSSVLHGALPGSFVSKYVHWYNVNDGSVEFRPWSQPWKSSEDQWRLTRVNSRDGNGSWWQMIKGDSTVLSPSSQLASRLSAIFSPVQDPNHIVCIYRQSMSTVDVDLPHVQLGFQLKVGSSLLASQQFRGFSVDSNQSLRTLGGLESRLLLKAGKPGERLVLVPGGKVSLRASSSKTSSHVSITIGNQKGQLKKPHVFSVDERLGRLVDKSLHSKLFLAYLHALTSFCLPDPLLGRTGTEQALEILSSAAIRSGGRFDEDCIALLKEIARLSPRRSHGTHGLAVEWVPELGFLAHHGRFQQLVVSIMETDRTKTNFFPREGPSIGPFQQDDEGLVIRDAIRSAVLRVAGFGAEDFTADHDKAYSARDMLGATGPVVLGHKMSLEVHNGAADVLRHPLPEDFKQRIVDFFSTWRENPEAVVLPLSRQNLAYHPKWISSARELLYFHWCKIHRHISEKRAHLNKFDLSMWVSTLCASSCVPPEMIQVLVSFFLVPETGDGLTHTSFNDSQMSKLEKGINVDRKALERAIRPHFRPVERCPEANLQPSKRRESKSALKIRIQETWEKNSATRRETFTSALLGQWPRSSPETPVGNFEPYVDVPSAMEAAKDLFSKCMSNQEAFAYFDHLERVLKPLPLAPDPELRLGKRTVLQRAGVGPRYVSIDSILTSPPGAPPPPPPRLQSLADDMTTEDLSGRSNSRVRDLVSRIQRESKSEPERKYAKALRQSADSMPTTRKRLKSSSESDTLQRINIYCEQHRRYVDSFYNQIVSSLTTSDTKNEAALKAGQCPRVSPIFLLQQLARDQWAKLPNRWKRRLVEYGVALTELQQAERLVKLSGSQDLLRELDNVGHSNWDPIDFPESLLLEVESGIMIREVQETIATEMRRSQGKNAVMQLNMGEGKSSVIIPIVAAALADGSQLVRVIVTKPQMGQMYQMLVNKLGGLLNRRIYRLPLSRAVKLGLDDLQRVQAICEECVRNGGVLLMQPEHIQSFQLMCIERIRNGGVDNENGEGRLMLEIQESFDQRSRDIVDESDDIFSVNFELVFTTGLQGRLDFSPDRWIGVQQVLGRLRELAPTIFKTCGSSSMELTDHCIGGFPRLRILDNTAENLLVEKVAMSICQQGLPCFRVGGLSPDVQWLIYRFIKEPNIAKHALDEIESGIPQSESTNQMLLLLRGIFAEGILSFCLRQKRWRVDFGLDRSRTPCTNLAVPYRAKDSPAMRAEFSHPEVVMVLTSFSYYYGGLEDDELKPALEHLLASEDAETEYQQWVKDAPDLKPSLKQLTGVNLKDEIGCTVDLFPALKFAKAAIDYYLANIVFPREMREWSHKLSASGCDIGKVKSLPTTGFSGTIDSKDLLPLSMEYLDLPGQKYTSAQVLDHILQPENKVVLLSDSKDAVPKTLLEYIIATEPPVKVVLDVGAQILDRNEAVASEWLHCVQESHAKAVVYFDSQDELCVLDRKGAIEPLQTSPFATQLDQCLILLDEAHTRGTDLKLPDDYRAAVTLGAKLTKDRLVQACMRMRKLGHGQSVVFYIPEEIQTKIKNRNPGCVNPFTQVLKVDVFDVLDWAIQETLQDIRRSIPLWAVQARGFRQRQLIWEDIRRSGEVSDMTKEAADLFLEEEAQTLETRYKPDRRNDSDELMGEAAPDDDRITDGIMQRCREFGNIDFKEGDKSNEQERELAPEIEQEREVEKPPRADPYGHSCHQDVRRFVSTGRINPPNSPAFLPAFESLRKTSAAQYLDVAQFPTDILVTADFARTVQPSEDSTHEDSFQRNVQWILTSTGADTSESATVQHVVIISPYEAQELIDKVRASKSTALHIYAPRCNLAFPTLDGLDLYTEPRSLAGRQIPSHLKMQINLFAGQLYVSSYAEYRRVSSFLGVSHDAGPDGEGDVSMVDDDAFRQGTSPFSKNPNMFLKTLSTIRRPGGAISRTHMGKLLDGVVLEPDEFEAPAEASEEASEEADVEMSDFY